MGARREIARLTRGAYCRFAPGAGHELGELLRAAAAYAAGGMKALVAAAVCRKVIFLKPTRRRLRLLRYIGAGGALLFALFLLFRGEIGPAISIALLGLGLIG